MRFEQMMDQGAMDEIKDLNAKIESGELDDLSPITKAIGFRPFRDYLYGQIDWQEAMNKAKAQTRQYAKRQRTWFRHQLPGNLKSIVQFNPDIDQPLRINRTNNIKG